MFNKRYIMTIAKESFLSDGNVILKLSNKYSPTTVSAKSVSETNVVENITIIELGESYIEIPVLPNGYTIVVEYNIAGTLPSESKDEYDLKERIVRLEQGMEDMYEIIKAQKMAIDNRLNITAFRAWIKLVEKKMGIKLIEGNMNFISKELYKDE